MTPPEPSMDQRILDDLVPGEDSHPDADRLPAGGDGGERFLPTDLNRVRLVRQSTFSASSVSRRLAAMRKRADQAQQMSLGSQLDVTSVSSEFALENSVTLYLGDCLEFLQTIPDESVQLVVTSPPYNIGKEYEDVLDIEVYKTQQRRVIEECVRVLRSEGSICWQVGNYVNNGEIIPLDILLYDCFKGNGLKLRNRIIWYFGHGLHCTNRFSGRYETINWFTKSDDYVFNLDPIRVPQKYPGKKHFKGPKRGEYSSNPKGKNPSDVWDIPNVKSNHIEKTDHPCQFPVALIQRLVLSMTNKDDLVFDPFMGVGTTAVAAIINDRRAAGAETLRHYYDIAIRRVQQALAGELRYRPDKPVYKPPKDSKLATAPWDENDFDESTDQQLSYRFAE